MKAKMIVTFVQKIVFCNYLQLVSSGTNQNAARHSFVRLFGSQTCGMSPEDVDKIKSGIGECTGHLFRAMVESGDQQ